MIRAKKLAVLIRDARLASGKEVELCAAALGVTGAEFEAFETGERSPSLPQLESLAFLIDVPLDHFWGDTLRSTGRPPLRDGLWKNRLKLRDRIIGAMLRKARLEAGLSAEKLAEQASSTPALIDAYELGEMSVSLPDLEGLASILNRSIYDFLDSQSPVGVWAEQKRSVQEFMALVPNLKTFVVRPESRPYLEMAQRLSEMPVEKLRAAEALLESTD
jgi:transcriptional regulator with XRE-family HTH domain